MTEVQSQLYQPTRKASIINRRIEFQQVREEPDPNYARLRELMISQNMTGNLPAKSNLPPTKPSYSAYKTSVNEMTSKTEASKKDNKLEGGFFQWNISAGLCPTPNGLINAGNTCFMNSVLQSLTFIQPVFNYAASKAHVNSCNQSGFCSLCSFHHHVLRSVKSTKTSRKPFLPGAFIKGLKNIAKTMRHGRQEDAHEFLRFLVDSFQKCCAPDSKFAGPNDSNFISKIFSGRFSSTVKCRRCGHESVSNDPFMDLSLDINHANSIELALRRFIQPENLGGKNQYKCSGCKQMVDASKSMTIKRAPPVLCVQLKRFNYGAFGSMRIGKHVNFKEQLDISPFLSKSTKLGAHNLYNLQAVLVHAGHSPNSGHYFCFVKSPSGIWYRVDDEEVSQVKLSTVLQQNAYILFYVEAPTSEILLTKNLMNYSAESFLDKPEKRCLPEEKKNGPIVQVAPKVISGVASISTILSGKVISRNVENGDENNSTKDPSHEASEVAIKQILDAKSQTSNDSTNSKAKIVLENPSAETKQKQRDDFNHDHNKTVNQPMIDRTSGPNSSVSAILSSKTSIGVWDDEKPTFVPDLPKAERKRKPSRNDLEYDSGKQKKKKKHNRWQISDSSSKSNPFTKFQTMMNRVGR